MRRSSENGFRRWHWPVATQVLRDAAGVFVARAQLMDANVESDPDGSENAFP
jgi:hypothetical protein